MNTFTFAKTATEIVRDTVVLTLRKAGYKASRETDTLTTDASITVIGLAYGTTAVVERHSSFAAAIRSSQDARDAKAMYQCLVEDNERRIQRGLPGFEPSYELAEKIIKR